MIIHGQVVRKIVAEQSKSERAAVVLVTPEGEFVLRRKGGNPFSDPALDEMVGMTVSCEGTQVQYIFILDDWHEIDTV